MSNPRSGKKIKKLFVKTVKTAWICTDMQTFGKKTGEVGSYNGCQYFCQMAVILKSKMMEMITVRKLGNI